MCCKCLFGKFLGDAIQPFTTVDFAKDVSRRHAAFGPNHCEMVKHVGALKDHGLAIHLHGVEADLNRFLEQLFRHFLHAVAK